MKLKKATRPIEAIYLHCTATAPGIPVSVEAIRRYHVDVRGWLDIGYHYVVQPDGKVEIGRDVERPGAHVKGDNGTTIGVCMVGNWDEVHPVRDDPQIFNTGRLIAELCELYGLEADYDTCLLHRDASSRPFVPDPHKSCPGINIHPHQLIKYIRWHQRRLS